MVRRLEKGAAPVAPDLFARLIQLPLHKLAQFPRNYYCNTSPLAEYPRRTGHSRQQFSIGVIYDHFNTIERWFAHPTEFRSGCRTRFSRQSAAQHTPFIAPESTTRGQRDFRVWLNMPHVG